MALLVAARARVLAGTMPATRCNELEMVTGINANPHGLLASEHLHSIVDTVSACTYDWVHNMLQDGVFSVEVQAVLTAVGVERAAVQAFLSQTWVFPRFHAVKSKQLHRIFDERRVSANQPEKIKASCAELLGVYGLLRHFVECEVPRTAATEAPLRSFFAVCAVLDLMLAAKFRTADFDQTWRRLEAATVDFLKLHKEAYGETKLKPKHHWQLDVPRQLERDGMVLDAFVIERTHLAVKSVADFAKNTSDFEASVLASLSHKVWSADEPVLHGLLGKCALLPGSADVYVADKMQVFGVDICVDDVVCKGDALGTVRGCCLHRGELVAFVEVLAQISRISDHSGRYVTVGRLAVWLATELQHALAWRALDEGQLLVIRR